MSNNQQSVAKTQWELAEQPAQVANCKHSETLFSQANGYIGTRGTFEEGPLAASESCEGVYLNGVFSREPIAYGESAFAFATHNHKLLQAPNCKDIRLSMMGVDASISRHTRSLDQATGILSRSFELDFGSHGRVLVQTERFVSMASQHLMCIRYQIRSIDFNGDLQLSASLDGRYGGDGLQQAQAGDEDYDPRAGQLSIQHSIEHLSTRLSMGRIDTLHKAKGSHFMLSSTCLDTLCADVQPVISDHTCQQRPGHIYQLSLSAGQQAELQRFALYHHEEYCHEESEAAQNNLLSAVGQSVEKLQDQSWQQCKEQHCKRYAAFWQTADIQIDGDEQTQQGLRFNMFHLFQSVGRNGYNSIAAKGLSGPGYDGHYFWDTEIYIIPFFTFCQPDIARQLLLYRYHTLDSARTRARQMSHQSGALYAWRTIGGEECSAYYPAGTAQYHINSAIARAIRTYVEGTDDWDFVYDYGAEILFETARLWLSLGYFNGKRFCIDGVTGPDEYTAVVNNNFYTNFMAAQHLRFALEVLERFEQERPGACQALLSKLDLSPSELFNWQKAASDMYLPFDKELGIHAQDDTFLSKQIWDLKKQPKDKMPLLLHYHPLVIYRHQVLKQADVVLAMFLADDVYSTEQKTRNLDYYEPLTTHDSTLSSCIHSILYAETGQLEKAYRYFADSARMDLDNLHHNTEYGVHTACMAGSWNCMVYGFMGMRVRRSGLHFSPRLPAHWKNVELKIRYRNRLLGLSVSQQQVSFTLLQGQTLELQCDGQSIQLLVGDCKQVKRI